MSAFAEMSFAALTDSLASAEPTPGAGPALACTCAVAAALVEMVAAVALRHQPPDPEAARAIGDRAAELRRRVLSLADLDAAAYGEVLAAQRRRGEPDYSQRLRQALGAAADPPVAIVEAAAELATLAVAVAQQARGPVRGEAVTAVALAAAVARAGVPLVELNLGGAPDDPRLDRVRQLASTAEELGASL